MAVEGLGLYGLGEMRRRVWHWLNALKTSTFDEATGEATGTEEVQRLYPKEVVDMALNQALTARYVDCVLNSDTLFADETTIDVVANQVEYPLPEDLAQLRGLWWKDPGLDFTTTPPNERQQMHLLDEFGESMQETFSGAPTYRRFIGGIRLNQVPEQDNEGGILVRYVKWALYLATDDQVIETEFARLLQEIIILDSTYTLSSVRGGLVFDTLIAERATWETRLGVMVRNASIPPSVQFLTQHPHEKRSVTRWP